MTVKVEKSDLHNPVRVENPYKGLDYNLLHNIPTVDGKEIKGDMTTEQLIGFDKDYVDRIASGDAGESVEQHNADEAAHPYLLNETNTLKNDLGDLGDQVAGIEAKIPAEAGETNQLADKRFVRDLTSALNFVKWVDALPETGESKYIYAVPREETDTEGKQIAALYLWDGSAWRGAGAFSLNIDPDTLATKTELAGYLPLSGGTLSGNLVVRKDNSEINIKSYGYRSVLKLDNSEKYDGSSSAVYNIACFEKQLYIYRADRGAANSILIDANGFLARRTPSGNFLFIATDSKGVANGIATLDANGKVPLSQLPDNIGGGAPTLKWYKNNTGSTVTIDDTSSASLVKVYKNGVLLEPEEDYSISGTTLTLTTELISTDKITTEVF